MLDYFNCNNKVVVVFVTPVWLVFKNDDQSIVIITRQQLYVIYLIGVTDSGYELARYIKSAAGARATQQTAPSPPNAVLQSWTEGCRAAH